MCEGEFVVQIQSGYYRGLCIRAVDITDVNKEGYIYVKYKKQGKILLHYQMKGANTQYDKLKPEHNNKMWLLNQYKW